MVASKTFVEPDRHIRRSGDDYTHAFLSLLPQGQAWPREPDSTLARSVKGLCQYWGHVDGRAGDLLERESDPRITIELILDWERAFGLPDPCIAEPLTLADRQRMLVHRMTLLGAQSRQYFYDVAASIDHQIRIREYAPVMTGVTRCGRALDDAGYQRWQVGPPENRFFWTVHVDKARLGWFRASSGECGIDPLLRIGHSTDLECLFNRWKPAHTKIVYDYGEVPVS
jgi:uncharacterized protein YmfQ (DUF2313 family)